MTTQRLSKTTRDPRIFNGLDADTPVSIEDVAVFLGKSTRTINRYINARLLPRPVKKAGTRLAVFYAGDIRQAVAAWRGEQ
jgi:predicted DNA-binding transcriptional regulator AlpA